MGADQCACCGKAGGSDAVRLHSHPEVVICSGCLEWLNAQRAKRVAAHGGAVRVVNVEPIFTVADVGRSIDHYQRLGFSTSTRSQAYAFAHRDARTIHLAGAVAGSPAGGGSLYLHIDDADALAASWRLAGLEVEGPTDSDYGKREGSHTDPDGNLIRFGSPLGQGPDPVAVL